MLLNTLYLIEGLTLFSIKGSISIFDQLSSSVMLCFWWPYLACLWPLQAIDIGYIFKDQDAVASGGRHKGVS